jgi:hypothetical protein
MTAFEYQPPTERLGLLMHPFIGDVIKDEQNSLI